jgi:hypothetical protein
LAALAVGLSFFLLAAFLYLWRKIPKASAKGDKANAVTSSRASTLAHSGKCEIEEILYLSTDGIHSVLFSAVIIISIVNVSGISVVVEDPSPDAHSFRLVQQLGRLSG